MIEKGKIVPSGHGQDQARIYVDNEVIENPLKLEDEIDLRIDPTINKREGKAELSIAHRKIHLTLIQENHFGVIVWAVKHATINLARCIFGHNARIITTDEELQQAVTIANEMINKVVTQDSQDLIIPGISPASSSYWNYLEIATQIHDPGSKILRSLKNTRLLHYNSDNFTYEDLKTSGNMESVYMGNPTKPILCCYRKDIEIAAKNSEHQDKKWCVADHHRECLRIETRLHGRKMINVMMDDQSAYECKTRLTAFGVADVHAAHRITLSNLKGIFHDSGFEYTGPKKFKALTNELIEKIKVNPDATPVFQLLYEMRQDGVYTDVSIRTIRSNIDKYLEATSSITLDQIVPDLDSLAPMHIEPMKDISGELVPAYPTRRPTPIDPRIAEAYSGISTLNLDGGINDNTPWTISKS